MTSVADNCMMSPGTHVIPKTPSTDLGRTGASFHLTGRSTVSTATTATGLKGRLASLEEFIAMQNEELSRQRAEIEVLLSDKAATQSAHEAQLGELKKSIATDLQRIQEESRRHIQQQKAENSRLQQQVTTLKGEKTSLQQQILGVQRRIQEVEEQIGSE